MAYTLHIGNKRYSSWSMRPWVLFHALDIPFKEELHIFGHAKTQPQLKAFSPTGKVPCLEDHAGGEPSIVVWDSLAICEHVAEAYPRAWPASASARAFARSAAAEMHSGFQATRDQLNMIVALRVDMGGPPSAALQRDLDRFSELFAQGLARFGGPWLTGAQFTVADAMFAPVAVRLKIYSVELASAPAREYADRLYEHLSVQAWIQAGIKETAREPYHEAEALWGEGRKILEDRGLQA